MENPTSFVRNGEIKLPIGFRFHPTDEELVVHYLRRKALSWPLPASVIPELDVFHSNPFNLPGDLKEKRYFFSKRNGNGNNRCMMTRVVLSTGSGYWKVIGKKKHIVASQTNQAVGMKRTLVFYQGKSPHVSRTSWVMHEYSLLGFPTSPNLTQKSEMGVVEDWVVHKVFEKKRRVERNKVSISQQYNSNSNNRSNNNNTNHQVVIRPSCIDIDYNLVEENFDLGGPPQASSSSCSSEVTDQASSNGTATTTTTTDQEETSGYLKNSLNLSSYSAAASCMMRKH